MTEISTSAASARESARQSDGRFGTQSHGEPEPLAPVTDPRSQRDLIVSEFLSEMELGGPDLSVRTRAILSMVDPERTNDRLSRLVHTHARMPSSVDRAQVIDEIARHTDQRGLPSPEQLRDAADAHITGAFDEAARDFVLADDRYGARVRRDANLDAAAVLMAPEASRDTHAEMVSAGRDELYGGLAPSRSSVRDAMRKATTIDPRAHSLGSTADPF